MRSQAMRWQYLSGAIWAKTGNKAAAPKMKYEHKNNTQKDDEEAQQARTQAYTKKKK